MEYLIRNFREDDLDQLIALCSNHAAYEKMEYNPQGKGVLLKETLLSASPCLYCWIVSVKDDVVGYATFTFDFSTWDACRFLHLDCIYIKEHFRGFGIGEDIIKRLVEAARKEGCINIQWQTPMFNEKAIRFYRRIGAVSKEKLRFSITIL